jgi:hypothetical protein
MSRSRLSALCLLASISVAGAACDRADLLLPSLRDEGPSPEPDLSGPCDFGRVTGDVYGRSLYFAGGTVLPAGHYRVTFADGCMKYNGRQNWTVNAYALGDSRSSDHWWFVSNGAKVIEVIPPGTVGFQPGIGGYPTFDECVRANRELAPVDLDLPAGTLAIWLEDDPYTDNVVGQVGRNPTWSLQCAPNRRSPADAH